jgi:competence protein ComEC
MSDATAEAGTARARDRRATGPFGAATSPIVTPAALAAAAVTWLDGQRHRWFLWLPVAVGGGIGLYFALPEEPAAIAVAAPLMVAAALVARIRDGTVIFAATRVLLAVATGLALAKARTEQVRAPVVERPTARVDVRGFVVLVEPSAGKGGPRVTLDVATIGGLTPEATPRRVRLRLIGGGGRIAPGDAIVVRARLSPPGAPILPGGYDFGRRAWYLGIGAVGVAFETPRPDPDPPPATTLARTLATIEGIRRGIGAAVAAALPGPSGGIATALLTGERGGIPPDLERAYRDSGLTHVLSISGLHMTVMAGTLFLAVRFALAAIPGIALRFPIKKWAAAVAIVGALGYLAISGAAFATLRSYVMISIVFLAVLAERPALALRNVALAALVVLVVWPESLLDPGFQMSFAAVTALLAALEAWQARQARLGRDIDAPGPLTVAWRFIVGIVASTLIAGLAVAPLAAYHFHTSQQYSVLGNVLAVPVCDLVVMPALLATLLAMPFGLEAWPLAVAGLGIDTMTAVAVRVAALPGAVAAIPSVPLGALLAMVAGGLWLLLWRGRWRLLGLAGIALGLALAPQMDHPALIVGHDGLLAARVDGTRLSSPASRRGSFELSRWLEADGDRRTTTDAATGAGYRCDGLGCTATLDGLRVSAVRHPAALAEDCRTAHVVVTPLRAPATCRAAPAATRIRTGMGTGIGPDAGSSAGSPVVVDRTAIERHGVHALYLAPPSPTDTNPTARLRIVTVADLRGSRPWSTPPARPARRPARAASVPGTTAPRGTRSGDSPGDSAGTWADNSADNWTDDPSEWPDDPSGSAAGAD